MVIAADHTVEFKELTEFCEQVKIGYNKSSVIPPKLQFLLAPQGTLKSLLRLSYELDDF